MKSDNNSQNKKNEKKVRKLTTPRNFNTKRKTSTTNSITSTEKKHTTPTKKKMKVEPQRITERDVLQRLWRDDDVAENSYSKYHW